MAKILIIGVMSGFPWVLIGSMLSLWLKEEGFSRSSIGLFGAVGSVYAFNALWAPVVDSLKIPLLGALGQRRSWIILCQIILAILVATLFFLSPDEHLAIIAAVILLIAIASATQDVAIDALRIELISTDEVTKIGAGAAMATCGWWLGYGFAGALLLTSVEWLQQTDVGFAWQAGYLLSLVFIVIPSVLLLAFIREPDSRKDRDATRMPVDRGDLRALARRIVAVFVMPIVSFVKRYGGTIGLCLLLFIFFFKIGEAFLGRMSLVFYSEIGFSKSDIALYSKGYGTLAVCLFAIVGSLINAHYGLWRGIFVGGIAMAATNLLFALLAHFPSDELFAVAVVLDQFTAGVSTVALVAFISQLCDRNYTATQYAALASVGNLSRTMLAAGSGFLIDGLGGNWSVFFLITTLMVTPSLLLLYAVRTHLKPIFAGVAAKVL